MFYIIDPRNWMPKVHTINSSLFIWVWGCCRCHGSSRLVKSEEGAKARIRAGAFLDHAIKSCFLTFLLSLFVKPLQCNDYGHASKQQHAIASKMRLGGRGRKDNVEGGAGLFDTAEQRWLRTAEVRAHTPHSFYSLGCLLIQLCVLLLLRCSFSIAVLFITTLSFLPRFLSLI